MKPASSIMLISGIKKIFYDPFRAAVIYENNKPCHDKHNQGRIQVSSWAGGEEAEKNTHIIFMILMG